MCSGICWYSWSTHWAECSGAGWEALAVTQSPAPYLASSGAEWSASQCPVIVLLRRIITPRSLLNTSVMIRRHSQFLEYSLGIPLIIKDLLNFSTATHQIGAGLMRVCVCHDVPSLSSARLCLSPVSWVSGPGCLMSPCPTLPGCCALVSWRHCWPGPELTELPDPSLALFWDKNLDLYPCWSSLVIISIASVGPVPRRAVLGSWLLMHFGKSSRIADNTRCWLGAVSAPKTSYYGESRSQREL